MWWSSAKEEGSSVFAKEVAGRKDCRGTEWDL